MYNRVKIILHLDEVRMQNEGKIRNYWWVRYRSKHKFLKQRDTHSGIISGWACPGC